MKRALSVGALLTLLCAVPQVRAAVITLDFSDIAVDQFTGESLPFYTYANSGFRLQAFNPATGILTGMQAHGPNSMFYAGANGVSAYPPSNPPFPPANTIQIDRPDNTTFTAKSIALAKN